MFFRRHAVKLWPHRSRVKHQDDSTGSR